LECRVLQRGGLSEQLNLLIALDRLDVIHHICASVKVALVRCFVT